MPVLLASNGNTCGVDESDDGGEGKKTVMVETAEGGLEGADLQGEKGEHWEKRDAEPGDRGS